MAIKYLAALAALTGLVLAGQARAADATKDLAACVWNGMSNADRAALTIDPSHLPSDLGDFNTMVQAHPSADAAFDRCRNGATTPVLWKGHFIFNLGMEYGVIAQEKALGVDADRLAAAWAIVPADRQPCFGILTAWAIISVNKSDEAALSPVMADCNSAPAQDAMQSFTQATKLDVQSDAGKMAGMYAFAKGGEAVVISLMTHKDTPAASTSNP